MEETTFTPGRIDIHLGDNNTVTFDRTEKKILVYTPDGNPRIVKSVDDNYTLEEFCKFCEKIANDVNEKVYPWNDKKEKG